MATSERLVKIADPGGDTVTLAQFPNGHFQGPMFANFDYDALKTVPLRHDDVILCSYPRSGCHWLWEQLRMLLAGSTDLPVQEKQSGMFENGTPESYESLPSPRVLNTHVLFDELPAEVTQGKAKVVLIYRHPKDSALSLYHLYRAGHWWDYHGQLHNFLHLFIQGKVDGGSVADYLNDWSRVIAEYPHLPLHVLSYENLKKNPVEELTRLSRFLGKDHDVSFLQAVTDACAIDKMRERKKKIWDTFGVDQTLMYREGKTEGWRASFTEEMNRQFDQYWRDRFKAAPTFPMHY